MILQSLYFLILKPELRSSQLKGKNVKYIDFEVLLIFRILFYFLLVTFVSLEKRCFKILRNSIRLHLVTYLDPTTSNSICSTLFFKRYFLNFDERFCRNNYYYTLLFVPKHSYKYLFFI